MRTARVIIWTVALAALCALVPPLAGAGDDKPGPDLSAEDRAALDRGELVMKIEDTANESGVKDHWMRAFRIIAVPPEEVWKVLSSPEKDYEWIPGMEKSEVINKGPDFVDVHYEVKVLFMSFQFNIHRVFHHDELFIKNDLIPTMENDLTTADSFYRLHALDGGEKTIMDYSLHLVVSPQIPEVVADWFAQKSCKNWMENLKKRAESRGEWKKS